MTSKKKKDWEEWKGVPGIGERKLKMCIRQPSSRLFIAQNEASELFFLFHFLLFSSSLSSSFASISTLLSLSLSLSHTPTHTHPHTPPHTAPSCGFLEDFLRFLTLTKESNRQALPLVLVKLFFFCFFFLLLFLLNVGFVSWVATRSPHETVVWWLIDA